MFWERKLEKWVDEVKTRNNLSLRLELWNGAQHDFGEFKHPRVVMRVKRATALPLLLSADIDQLGDAYVRGEVDVEGEPNDIIAAGYVLADKPRTGVLLANAYAHFQHSRDADSEAIRFHYDLSNEFFASWLDREMVYSCAYFEHGDEDLDTAQMAKIDHILTKLDLRPGQRLLDIGCGWGALVRRAATRFQARCVGITLSEQQYELARERVARDGLSDLVEIRLEDYRDVRGRYDRISSVGMSEHVGLDNLTQYFTCMHDLLAEGGVAMNHSITASKGDGDRSPLPGGHFINKYIFPNGELPHLSTLLEAMRESGLEAIDVENLRRHYQRTLTLWSARFEAQADFIRAHLDETRYRIWRLYLAGCAHAFAQDRLSLYQILCHRSGQDAACLPWSRGRWYRKGR